DAALQQSGLAGSRRAHKIERAQLECGQRALNFSRDQLVRGRNILSSNYLGHIFTSPSSSISLTIPDYQKKGSLSAGPSGAGSFLPINLGVASRLLTVIVGEAVACISAKKASMALQSLRLLSMPLRRAVSRPVSREQVSIGTIKHAGACSIRLISRTSTSGSRLSRSGLRVSNIFQDSRSSTDSC